MMSVPEFLAWNAPPGQLWQLVDGEALAMALASRTHNAIQGELGRLIGNLLAERGSSCTVLPTPGIVPRVRSDANFRIPDLAVTCSPYRNEEYALTDPVLLIEILSPSNQAETWSNVWAYTTIPTVQEIVVLGSTSMRAEIVRRNPDGSWPERPLLIEGGQLELHSVGFSVDLAAIYRTTRLAAG